MKNSLLQKQPTNKKTPNTYQTSAKLKHSWLKPFTFILNLGTSLCN